MKLVAPTKKPIKLKAIRPPAGVADKYQRTLENWITEMHKSILYFVKATYRANTPHGARLAQDASPSREMDALLKRLSRRWQKRFLDGGEKLAKWFAESNGNYSDKAVTALLRDAGFSVELKLSRHVNDILQATISKNVGLIKSIASNHFEDIQHVVMDSFAAGRDLETLTVAIEGIYGKTYNRAKFIAQDQNNKLTATMEKTRRLELGLNKAIWRHSHGGVKPRESHEAADGEEFDIDKGCLIDGEYIQPGELPYCRCASIAIIPGLDN